MTNKKNNTYPRSVRLFERHINWLENNSINFSDWVRKKLDEEISK